MVQDATARRVLVVEDESDIASLLVMHLQDLGLQPSVSQDGLQALARLRNQHWDLVILDLRLPGLDGLELCRRLRADGHNVPIIMLTAKSAELDRVLGLEVGADDYVTKPFSVVEVMARVRAHLRRSDMSNNQTDEVSPPCLDFGDLHIDQTRREVTLAGTPLELTPKEFELLVFFAGQPGRVFPRTQLLDEVWGYGHEGYEHTVNSHINRLRRKLNGESSAHRYIHTVWGVGYKFVNEPRVAPVA